MKKLYYLLDETEQETHDTHCCCGMQTDLPHTAYGASMYELDLPGLQALYAMIAGLDEVSFPDWCNEQEPQSTYYGASEAAAVDEALIQARKQEMILINYPQEEISLEKETLPRPPEERITLSPMAYVQQIVDQVNATVKKYQKASPLQDYLTEQKALLSTHGWYLYYDPYANDPEGAYTVVPLDQVNLGYEIKTAKQKHTLAEASFLNTLKHRVKEVIRTVDTSKEVYSDTIEAAQVKHEISVLLSELRVHGLLPQAPSMFTTLVERAKQSFFFIIEHHKEELLTMEEVDRLSDISETIGLVLDELLDEKKAGYSQMLLACCEEDNDLFSRELEDISCIFEKGSPEHCVYHSVYEMLHSVLEQAFDVWYQEQKREKS